jgi:hypothetical protein
MGKNKIITDDRKILEQDNTLPHCIICDIDGTLALINGRGVYDNSKIYTDRVNTPVKSILYTYAHLDVEIIYLSGRMESSRNVTEKWLYDNDLHFSLDQKLYMRKLNDYRKDDVVKQELYEEYIKDKYFVEFILDDRNSVVDMWRNLGLLCLQVYYGDF